MNRWMAVFAGAITVLLCCVSVASAAGGGGRGGGGARSSGSASRSSGASSTARASAARAAQTNAARSNAARTAASRTAAARFGSLSVASHSRANETQPRFTPAVYYPIFIHTQGAYDTSNCMDDYITLDTKASGDGRVAFNVTHTHKTGHVRVMVFDFGRPLKDVKYEKQWNSGEFYGVTGSFDGLKVGEVVQVTAFVAWNGSGLKVSDSHCTVTSDVYVR